MGQNADSRTPGHPFAATAIRRLLLIRIWIIEMRWNCNCCGKRWGSEQYRCPLMSLSFPDNRKTHFDQG